MKTKNKFLKVMSIFIVAALALCLFACNATDAVKNDAVNSFSELLQKFEIMGYITDINLNILTSPSGTEKFVWGSRVLILIDLSEFIDAGLDSSKLAGLLADEIFDLQGEWFEAEMADMPLVGEYQETTRVIEEIVEKKRDALSYCEATGHFSLSLGNKFAFLWAQNLQTNDADLIFALNPAPFLDAGLNPQLLENWRLTEIETAGERGETVTQAALVKEYNLA